VYSVAESQTSFLQRKFRFQNDEESSIMSQFQRNHAINTQNREKGKIMNMNDK